MHTRRIYRAVFVTGIVFATAVRCRAAFLDGTKCKVTVVPEKEAADKGEKEFGDTLIFANDKFTSTALLAKGFRPAPYRGEKEPNEAEFEVEQTSDTGDVVNWQGEIRGKRSWADYDGRKRTALISRTSLKAPRSSRAGAVQPLQGTRRMR